MLAWKGQLMLPQVEDVYFNQVLFEFYSSKVGGHVGMAKTLAHISFQFVWLGMHKRIKKFVRECQIC